MESDGLTPGWRLFRLTEKGNVPLSMVLELTRRCHLHCAHCYLNETQEPNTPSKLRAMKERELSAAEWAGVFDQLAEAGCLYLVLTGGEVFLRPDFLEIAASARARSFNVRVFTTAMHVGEAEARELARLGVERVEVSLYGRPETHAKVTLCESAFERSIRGVKFLRGAGLPVTIKSPLMTLNSGDLHWLQELAAELGALCTFDPTVVPRNDGSKDNLSLRLDAKTLDGVFADPRMTAPDNLEVSWGFAEGDYADFLCSAGRNAGAMDPYGNVYPCLQWLLKAGNVRTSSFKDIWRGSPVLEEIRKLKHEPRPDGGACGDAGGEGYCNNCPGLSQLENGDPLKPPVILHQIEKGEGAARRAAREGGRHG